MRTLCLLVICSLLAAGCSAIGFAYNNAPSWLAGELQDAFDLDDAQRLELDTRMQQFFGWHREQELDRYRQILDDAARNAADGITATEFLEFVDALRLALRRLLEQAIVSFGDLGLTLTPQQIDHYERYFSDESAKFRDYLELSSQQREIYRTEQAIERMQKWFGSLDENQLQKLRPRLAELPEFYGAWIEFRDARQRALVEALREAPSAGLSHQQLKTILLGPETDYARAFEAERTAYWRTYAQIVEELSGWLGKAQLKHAIERLQKYSLAFEDLGNDSQS
jgi:hypothetical protein